MIEGYKAFWQNYINYKDKTSRQHFWTPIILHIIVIFVVAVLGLVSFLAGSILLSALLFGLIGLFMSATIIPTITLTMRRFHDAGRQPRMAFILCIVTIIGAIAFDLSRHDGLAIFFALIIVICLILILIETLRPSTQSASDRLKWF
ncbi:DUF805 domain-containing protein [Staphylococcus pettenkoferi]|uniref:DUF805 domain-containing protein n=1 Tax=Staphylococcus pettenkoferi TaxID=170573 RepID=UPI0011A5A48B|nr:DUF805 domain-containing protein [Staphylococcus pettenkoferi]MCY1590496.1 DUF805 domain-containing protein [Staphylococcus pettenkoferi]MCY1597616.1 DUF805 domain-containing protein [Staphylococcus pettenkoferi]MCY1600035.1 DUF805 domain-containing protein [Staphylococcus pettenkoferi]MCY1601397.1 DUF805 domain-containing protein [Staphylococcus pettenkoferi]MCY1614291.1 DUF805 domain-containing protein [Staphylococcus pettenkoferi]